LDINGNELDSLSFAKKINDTLTINSNITFIIGGSYGVMDELRGKVDYKLSFSKLTFPHQLFRVLLLEQIYRAYKINNHEEYHK
jgi:23S rRNA (pseudouridine1915-N3)-methyltransferase